jgi:hypothetical protein
MSGGENRVELVESCRVRRQSCPRLQRQIPVSSAISPPSAVAAACAHRADGRDISLVASRRPVCAPQGDSIVAVGLRVPGQETGPGCLITRRVMCEYGRSPDHLECDWTATAVRRRRYPPSTSRETLEPIGSTRCAMRAVGGQSRIGAEMFPRSRVCALRRLTWCGPRHWASGVRDVPDARAGCAWRELVVDWLELLREMRGQGRVSGRSCVPASGVRLPGGCWLFRTHSGALPVCVVDGRELEAGRGFTAPILAARRQLDEACDARLNCTRTSTLRT